MLAVVIGIVVFIVFYRQADRSGRNGFRWGLVGSGTFLAASGIATAMVLQTTRMGRHGSGEIASPMLAVLAIGTAFGVAASAVVFTQALLPKAKRSI